MTHTVLIANRGEIARRVIRTARAQGWRTVALWTDADAEARHRWEADRAVHVASYLDIEAIVGAALEVGATHVHPGYGFLSERAPFARALAAAEITLVGPSAEVMDRMGRKDHARQVAIAAGVPVIASHETSADPASFDYPVLVKAAAGGGGKGMRVVHQESEFAEALAAAQREAAKSFGDDTMLIEKYVASGRHIEVQVVGDSHGTVLHFYERDCSTQRRHQKVLEEAPAPTLSQAQREAVTAAGVALAAQVGYVGAGTVEFLLDNATGQFYFLEMNTRLQVEHPVTEQTVQVDGAALDLVALQLLVATGQALPIAQHEIHQVGAAIEARVYAEDPFHGFLPQAGTAGFVAWPHGPGVRVDEALESGQTISTAYDPMLGKVIAFGPTREAARAGLVAALDDTTIMGLTTNAGFLRILAASEEFAAATIDTSWLDHHDVEPPSPDLAQQLLDADLLGRAVLRQADPWRPDGFRSAGARAEVVVRGRRVVPPPSWARTRPDGAQGPSLVEVPTGHGRVRPGRDGAGGGRDEVVVQGQRFLFEHGGPDPDRAAAVGGGAVVAPMPGTVLQVRVVEGDTVAAGDTLGVLEAMKMELPLTAPFAGTVTSVGAVEGSQVALGAALFTVEPAGG